MFLNGVLVGKVRHIFHIALHKIRDICQLTNKGLYISELFSE